jgi:hypothetical protein
MSEPTTPKHAGVLHKMQWTGVGFIHESASGMVTVFVYVYHFSITAGDGWNGVYARDSGTTATSPNAPVHCSTHSQRDAGVQRRLSAIRHGHLQVRTHVYIPLHKTVSIVNM